MCAASAPTSRESHTNPASCSVTSSAAPDCVLVMTGQAARERFHRGIGERVVERRQHERIGRAVVRRDVVLESGERHAVAHAVVAREGLVRTVAAIVAHDEEVRRRRAAARAPRSRPARPCGDSPTRPGENTGASASILYLARMRSRCTRKRRREQVRVHGVVQHGQPLVGQPEARLDVVADHLRRAQHDAQPGLAKSLRSMASV